MGPKLKRTSVTEGGRTKYITVVEADKSEHWGRCERLNGAMKCSPDDPDDAHYIMFEDIPMKIRKILMHTKKKIKIDGYIWMPDWRDSSDTAE